MIRQIRYHSGSPQDEVPALKTSAIPRSARFANVHHCPPIQIVHPSSFSLWMKLVRGVLTAVNSLSVAVGACG